VIAQNVGRDERRENQPNERDEVREIEQGKRRVGPRRSCSCVYSNVARFSLAGAGERRA
jgi:hypothetical protein